MDSRRKEVRVIRLRLGTFFVAIMAVAFYVSAAAQAPKPLTGLVPQHITISVEDMNRETDWYVKVLGFEIVPFNDTDPNFLNHHLTIPGYRIDLVKYKGSSRPAVPNPLYLQQGWIHIAFSVPDLDAALKQLQALHTDVKADSPDPKGVPSRLVVHDPEGNELEFFKR
jgi:catechol 2,3-dioxygenase-like lactoylglutathione lyase family enzyme